MSLSKKGGFILSNRTRLLEMYILQYKAWKMRNKSNIKLDALIHSINTLLCKNISAIQQELLLKELDVLNDDIFIGNQCLVGWGMKIDVLRNRMNMTEINLSELDFFYTWGDSELDVSEWIKLFSYSSIVKLKF